MIYNDYAAAARDRIISAIIFW